MNKKYIVIVGFLAFSTSVWAETQETCYYSATNSVQWIRHYNDQKEIISEERFCADGTPSGKYVKGSRKKRIKEIAQCGKNLKSSFPCSVSIQMDLTKPCDPNLKEDYFCGDDWLN